MILTDSISKWFGNFIAVDSIDLKVSKGEVVGFLGPNGAGKSTTMKMIAGYLPPSSGRAEVAGFDVSKQSREVRKRIGYLPETTPLYPEMRVEEFLRFRARLFSIARNDQNEAIGSVIERCWLDEVKRKPIGHLSKGYKQRVGLAAALLHNPPVLLLDEPTSGLDPSQIREMRSLIRELAGEHTIFLSTHILPEAEMTCDRVVIIARGKIRAEGSVEELRRSAAEKTSYVVETNTSAVRNTLESLAGVTDVRVSGLDEGWQRMIISTSSDVGDLRESISEVVTSNGGKIRELGRETPSLEQLFIRLTDDENASEVRK